MGTDAQLCIWTRCHERRSMVGIVCARVWNRLGGAGVDPAWAWAGAGFKPKAGVTSLNGRQAHSPDGSGYSIQREKSCERKRTCAVGRPESFSQLCE